MRGLRPSRASLPVRVWLLLAVEQVGPWTALLVGGTWLAAMVAAYALAAGTAVAWVARQLGGGW
jgi:hypothetical protein